MEIGLLMYPKAGFFYGVKMSKKDKIEIRDQVGNENRGEIETRKRYESTSTMCFRRKSRKTTTRIFCVLMA